MNYYVFQKMTSCPITFLKIDGKKNTATRDKRKGDASMFVSMFQRTRNTCDILKNWLITAICMEVGLFQPGMGSTFNQVFLETNSISESLSLGLLYWRKIPSFTLQMHK